MLVWGGVPLQRYYCHRLYRTGNSPLPGGDISTHIVIIHIPMKSEEENHISNTG